MKFDSSLFRYRPSTSEKLTAYDDWTDEELTELFEERSAIAEFDGGLSRGVADESGLDWMRNEIGQHRYDAWGSKPSDAMIQTSGRQSCRLTTVITN